MLVNVAQLQVQTLANSPPVENRRELVDGQITIGSKGAAACCTDDVIVRTQHTHELIEGRWIEAGSLISDAGYDGKETAFETSRWSVDDIVAIGKGLS